MCRETEEFSDRLLSAKTEVASFEPFILQKLASFTPEKLSVSLLGLQILRPAVAVLYLYHSTCLHKTNTATATTTTTTAHAHTRHTCIQTGLPWVSLRGCCFGDKDFKKHLHHGLESQLG